MQRVTYAGTYEEARLKLNKATTYDTFSTTEDDDVNNRHERHVMQLSSSESENMIKGNTTADLNIPAKKPRVDGQRTYHRPIPLPFPLVMRPLLPGKPLVQRNLITLEHYRSVGVLVCRRQCCTWK